MEEPTDSLLPPISNDNDVDGTGDAVVAGMEETEALDYQSDPTSPSANGEDQSAVLNNCEICGMEFPSRKGLQKHRLIHMTYTCPECEEELPLVVREEHRRSCVLPMDKSLTCDRCYNSFRLLSAFTRHRDKCRQDKISKHICCCRYCKLGFDKVGRCKQHVITMHRDLVSKEWKHECDVCGKKYKNRWTLANHHRRDHKSLEEVAAEMEEPLEVPHGEAPEVAPVRRWKCFDCSGLFSRKSRFEEHYQREHLPTWFRCRKCGEEFDELKLYRYHYRRVHVLGLRMRRHECRNCLENFPAKSRLVRHLREAACTPPEESSISRRETPPGEPVPGPSHRQADVDDSDEDNENDLMSMSPSSPLTLSTSSPSRETGGPSHHHQPHSSANNAHSSPFKCDLCPMEFEVKWTLHKHKRVVHQPPRFECTHCQQKFSFRFQLHKHSMGHLLSFKCAKCLQTFPDDETLLEHQEACVVAQASEDNICSCRFCRKGFNSVEDFGVHLRAAHPSRSRPPEDRYLCEDCGSYFDSPGLLRNHRGVHSFGVDNTFSCEDCFESLPNAEDLANHRNDNLCLREMNPELQLCSCRLCRGGFGSVGDFKVHFEKHRHIRGKKKTRLKRRDRAIRERDENRTIQCDLCVQRFVTDNGLRMHKTDIHGMPRRDHTILEHFSQEQRQATREPVPGPSWRQEVDTDDDDQDEVVKVPRKKIKLEPPAVIELDAVLSRSSSSEDSDDDD